MFVFVCVFVSMWGEAHEDKTKNRFDFEMIPTLK